MFLPETGRKWGSAKSVVLAEPVLAGREREFEELQRHLDLALEGNGATVFVSGEAGSGKTRLANEFLNVVKKKGVTVLAGWCLSNAAVPYFPFVEAFEPYLSSIEAGTAQQLGLKSWLMGSSWSGGREKDESLTPQVWRDQTFAAITKELLLMSTNRPTILFIDDIHWADSASLSLLHYISRAVSSERILVLATFRSEELTAPAEGQVHPLTETLRLMGREDLFKEIKLTNLDLNNVGRVAESMLGGSVHPEFIEKLARESRGNPLFIVESLRLLSEHGSLVQEQSQWRLSIDKLEIPTKVKDIILRRVSALKSDQRRVLDVASVVGDTFDPELLGAVLNQDSLQVLETLNAVSQSNSLVCCERNFFRFDHAKSREVLYEEIRLPLRIGYHARIAERIESKSQNAKPFPFSDLAYHYAQAENKEKAIKYSLEAGKDALGRFSNSEAIKHFTYILQAVSEATGYSDEKRTALEGLGDAYYGNCMFKDALKTFEQLGNNETGIIRLRAFRKAMDASFFEGNLTHLLDLTRKVGEYAADDRLESARVHMNIGRAFSNMGKMKEGLQEMEKAVQVFEEECSLPDTARALMGVAIIAVSDDQLEKAVLAVLHSIALYEELNDLRGQMDANNRAGQVFSICRFFEESWRKFAKAIEIGEKIGDYNRMAEASAFSSLLLEYGGDLEGAVSRSLKAAEQVKKTDSEVTQGIVYSALTRQYAKLEDLNHAEKYFNKLVELPREVLLNGMTSYPLSKAVFLATKNQWKEVNAFFEESLRMLKIHDNPSMEIVTRMNYSWALNKQERTVEAKAQIEEAQRKIEKLEKRFQHSIIHAAIIAPTEVEVDKEYNIRLDIVNIGKKPGKLVRVKELIPPESKDIALPGYYHSQNSLFSLKEKILGPLQVEPVKLSVLATGTGVFHLSPQVIYVDDMGETRTCKPNSVTITVKTKKSKIERETAPTTVPSSQPLAEDANFKKPQPQTFADTQSKFEFKTEDAQKTFDFLKKAFAEDYMRRRIALEQAGWRTLNEIVKEGKLSTYRVYGKGRGGAALAELEHRGVVETRIFLGERGRGGKIMKARICYEKEPIKREIDRLVAKGV